MTLSLEPKISYSDFGSHGFQNPKGFAIDLLAFLASQSDHLSSVGSVSLSAADKERLHHVVMALEALCNVIKNNPGIGSLSIWVHFVFSYRGT
jgi:DnaJ family protein C protein 13